MHGQPIIKVYNAKQTRQIYQYKKIKTKSHKNNAAIWYNKTCRIKQLIPTYINIRINGNTVISDNSLFTVTIPEAACTQLRSRPPEDEQVMLETCKGF
jgi:hypothetical protein